MCVAIRIGAFLRLRLVASSSLLLILLGSHPALAHQHLYIVHTNDIHGQLLPAEAFWMNKDFPPPLANAPGALRLIAELRDSAEARGYGFLLLDGGDVFQGTPLGNFTSGQAVARWFRRARYDVVALGNHDFDLGMEVLREVIDSSGVPWVATNIRVRGADTSPRFIQSSVLIERGGIKIGVFGLVTKYLAGMVSESIMAEIEVLPYYEVVRREIAELRRRGADIIVGLTHIGYRHDCFLADSVPGIDVIIGAHSHTGIRPPYESPRYHTIIQQAYSKLSTVGLLDISFDTTSRSIVGYQGRLIDLLAEAMPMDLRYLSELESLNMLAERGFDEVIGRSRRELTRGGHAETPAGNLITDAMREYFGVDIAIHNASGIRANIPEGDITYGDIHRVEIFGNTVVLGRYTGRQVLEMMEVSVNGHHAIFQVSGLRMEYDARKPIGQRVRSIIVGSEPLDMDRTYLVATNSFLAAGTGEYRVFAEGQEMEDTFMPLRDVIVAYIRRHSPVDARVEGRIVRVDR